MRDVPLIDHLSEPTRARLLTSGTEHTIEPGGFVLRDGEPAPAIYYVVDGLLKIVKTSMAGRVSFLGLRRTGTLVGELGVLADAPRSSSLEAIHPSRVRRIPGHDFERLLAECPDLSRALLGDLADRLREATAQVHDLIGGDGPTRMASRLVQLADDTVGYDGDGTALELPVSQLELGEWAGLSRAGAVNALRALRLAGLITTSRMSIVIVDLARLRTTAMT